MVDKKKLLEDKESDLRELHRLANTRPKGELSDCEVMLFLLRALYAIAEGLAEKKK